MRATESGITCKVYRADGSELDLSPYVQHYSDRHPVGGVPSYSLALPPTIEGESAVESVDNGDLIEVGLISTDGRTGPHGLGKYATTMIGVTRSIGLRQDVSKDALKQFALLSGDSLAGFLANDTINYYLAYGSSAGYFQALGLTPIDSISNVRLDAALAAYLENVAFNVLRIERPQGGIKELLGFAIETVDGQGLFDAFWANYSGSLWQFLETYSEKPVHELFQTILPIDRFNALQGKKNSPRTWGDDKAVPALVIRPAPFPFAKPGGAGTDFSLWNALPLHDLLDPEWSLDSADDELTDKGDGGVANFIYLYPKTLALDETMQITWAPPIMHDEKWKRFGYRPLSFATNLWGRDAAKEEGPEFFSDLNWRIAGQVNRADEYFEGRISIRLAPHIRPGERVRLNKILGDDTTAFQYYVDEVSHSFGLTDESRKTTLTLSRGLPESLYSDESWFTDGLVELPPIRDGALPVNQIRSHDEPGPTR